MFSRLTALFISAAISICCVAQKANQWDRYQPRTLASVIKVNKPLCDEMDASPEDHEKKKMLLTGDNFPSKVTLTDEGKSRPLAGPRRDVLMAWAKSSGRSEDMTQIFATEGLFEENGAHFWIALQKPLVDPIAEEVKVGQRFNAYVMWMGSIKVEDRWEWLFAMNEYDAPGADSNP